MERGERWERATPRALSPISNYSKKELSLPDMVTIRKSHRWVFWGKGERGL